jgi:hypothetical protein
VDGTNALQGSETTRFARQNDQKWATKRESADCNAIFQQPASRSSFNLTGKPIMVGVIAAIETGEILLHR